MCVCVRVFSGICNCSNASFTTGDLSFVLLPLEGQDKSWQNMFESVCSSQSFSPELLKLSLKHSKGSHHYLRMCMHAHNMALNNICHISSPRPLLFAAFGGIFHLLYIVQNREFINASQAGWSNRRKCFSVPSNRGGEKKVSSFSIQS